MVPMVFPTTLDTFINLLTLVLLGVVAIVFGIVAILIKDKK